MSTSTVTFDTAHPLTGAPALITATVTHDRSTPQEYPAAHCPDGTAIYRYDMAPGDRWFRCTACGIEMPEKPLRQRIARAA